MARGYRSFTKEQRFLVLAAISIFLPYFITGVVAVAFTGYFLLQKEYRDRLLVTKGFRPLLCVFAIALVIPATRGYWVGIGAGVMLCVIFLFFLFARMIINRQVLMHILDTACLLSLVSLVVAVLQYAMHQLQHDPNRSVSVFMNANYYGDMIVMIILCCVYQLINGSKRPGFYMTVIACNLLGQVLSDSMSALVALMGGIIIMLLLRGKRTAFCLMCGFMVLCLFAMISLPSVFPRSAFLEHTIGARAEIWFTAIRAIQDSPFWGHGVTGYFSIYNQYGAFMTYHAHSLYLNPLLDLGFIGTGFLLAFLFRMFQPALPAVRAGKDRELCSLLFAQLAAVLIHGVTDITCLWIQTGMFLSLLFTIPALLAPVEQQSFRLVRATDP